MSHSCFLFSCISLLQLTSGFFSSEVVYNHRDFGRVFSRQSTTSFRMQNNGSRTTSNLKPVKYDLGIGKNLPVDYSQIPNDIYDSHNLNVYQASSFLMEYESVREFPDPTKRQQTRERTKKQFPLLVPQRITDDSVITISSDGRAIAASKYRGEFDLNTAWIELMIHDERNKLRMAAAISNL